MIIVIFIRYLAYVADVMVRERHLNLVLAVVRVVPQLFLLSGFSLVKLDLVLTLTKVI